MKLYYAPGACSLSPHIVAREGNLPVEMVKVLFADGRTTESGENFYDINPMGYVPTLRLDNGEVLTEGVAIVQYLADQAPSANLVPQKGSMPYYRTLEWLTLVQSCIRDLARSFDPASRRPRRRRSSRGLQSDMIVSRMRSQQAHICLAIFLP